MSQEDHLDNDIISYLFLNPDFDFQNDSIPLTSQSTQPGLGIQVKTEASQPANVVSGSSEQGFFPYENATNPPLFYPNMPGQSSHGFSYPSTLYHGSSGSSSTSQPSNISPQQQLYMASHPHLVPPTPIPPTGPVPGLSSHLMGHPPASLYSSVSPLDPSAVTLTPSAVLGGSSSLHHSSPYSFHHMNGSTPGQFNYLSTNSTSPNSFTMANAALSSGFPSTTSTSSSTPPLAESTTKLKKTPSARTKATPKLSFISSLPKKRTRESLEDLELRVKELKTENADLQAHLLNVTQRTKEVQKQRSEMEKLMAEKLQEIEACQSSASVSTMTQLFNSLNSIIESYSDNYSDYGKCRQREVAYHLQQLEKLITPTTTTKMCLWTLQNKRNFYDRSLSPVYNLLCEELSLNSDQINKILERRKYVKNILIQQSECINLIKNLKNMIEIKHRLYDKIIGKVQKSSTPSQIVKFLVWVGEKHNELSEFIRGYSDKSHVNEDATIFLSDPEEEV